MCGRDSRDGRAEQAAPWEYIYVQYAKSPKGFRYLESVKQSPQLIAWITEYGEARSLRHFRESFRKVLLELS